MNKEIILIYGDDPTNKTGYAKVVDNLVSAVKKTDYLPVVVGIKYSQYKYGKCKVINANVETDNQDGKGYKTLEQAIVIYKAKLVITVCDPWDLDRIVDMKNRSPFHLVSYMPVETTPFSRFILVQRNPNKFLDVGYLFHRIDRIVAYTEFGLRAVKKLLLDYYTYSKVGQKEENKDINKISYIYHGIDTNVFKPMGRNESRKIFDNVINDNTFLFMIVKANCARAGFDTLLQAWSLFRKKLKSKPELLKNVKLYIHTNVNGEYYQVLQLMSRYNVVDSVVVPDNLQFAKGVNKDQLVKIYNAADVGLNTSRGEGFSLPILEMMACGKPVIVPDYAGPAEYVGNAGIKVPIIATYCPEYGVTDYVIANPKVMAQEMYNLMKNEVKRKVMGEKARLIANEMTWGKFHEDFSKVIVEEFEKKAKDIVIPEVRSESV